MFKFIIRIIFLLVFSLPCHAGVELDKLHLPQNFRIAVFAKIPNARSLSMGEKTIFVSTLSSGKIYALVLNYQKTGVEKIYTIAENLEKPNGIAFYHGNLYVAETNRIISFDNIENNLKSSVKPRVVVDNLPHAGGHDWRYMKIGPDGYLYLSIGAPCNVCLSKNSQFATIMRVHPDNKQLEIVANGVRNSMGFAWHPLTKELWFTDNGRDNLGDDIPPDELNHVTQNNLHFGFPYMYGNNLPDPEFGNKASSLNFIPPSLELGPHVAALGMIFYTGKMFPSIYHNQIFIAEHGSWNRSKKIGYRITWAKLQNGQALAYNTFIDGWLENETVWGRPVDLLQLPDGSLLISDDYAGAIYRVTYQKGE